MKKEIKIVRPTIRLDKEFNEELKIALEEKGITFQELTSSLLEKWIRGEIR